MKIICCFILLIAFSAHTFGGFIVLVDYEIRNERYKKGCVNKERISMKCDGKCQMLKKMQESDETEKAPGKKQLQKQIDLSSKSFFNTVIHYFTPGKKRFCFTGDQKIQDGYTDIFHPPPARGLHL